MAYDRTVTGTYVGTQPVRTRPVYRWVALLASLICLASAPRAWAQSASSREYQVKAAFLYNFIKFVDGDRFAESTSGRQEQAADANEPITVGIVGKDPFDKAFEPLKDKTVKGKKVVVKRFKGLEELRQAGRTGQPETHPKIEEMTKCHVLFVCPSERPSLRDLLRPLRECDILTVADMEKFLDEGGMINFVTEDKKVRFDINIQAAKRAKLKIRSQLLRLARRVVKTDNVQEDKND